MVGWRETQADFRQREAALSVAMAISQTEIMPVPPP